MTGSRPSCRARENTPSRRPPQGGRNKFECSPTASVSAALQCVISSRMRNIGGDVRTLAHVASDHEECCANVMPGEYVEQMQSVWIVRAIIEGERNLLCCAIPAAKIPAKPLPCGLHGLVGGNAGADKHANSKAEHGGIVNGGRNASKKACRKSL